MSQHPDELRKFVRLLRVADVRSYLEIGARHGDTFFAIMTALPAGSVGVAVDLPDAEWGLPDSNIGLNRCAEELRRRGYLIATIYGDSHTDRVRTRVAWYAPFDAVLIDADHRYEPLKQDWDDYSPMGRIVALHDIDGEGVRSHRSGAPIEVPILWRELKHDARIGKRKEIIGKRRGLGIGVAWMIPH